MSATGRRRQSAGRGPSGEGLKCSFNRGPGHGGRAFGVIGVLAAAALFASVSLASEAPSSTGAAEPATCQAVRLPDIGWTDVAATTALTAVLLEQRGYRPQITVLSVPVTYASLKHGDIDVFMGNWMPTQL